MLDAFHAEIDVNVQNAAGNSAMINTFRKISARTGNVRMVRIFLDWNAKHKKVDFALRNRDGKSVFDFAREARQRIGDDQVYQQIVDEMSKQAQMSAQ